MSEYTPNNIHLVYILVTFYHRGHIIVKYDVNFKSDQIPPQGHHFIEFLARGLCEVALPIYLSSKGNGSTPIHNIVKQNSA